MRVILTPAARTEVIEAQDWYEGKQRGLGVRFRSELEVLVERIVDNPYQFPVALKEVRCARMRKFPYSIFFRVESDFLVAIACFHASRDPRRWQQRI